jgi:hypothetical protein
MFLTLNKHLELVSCSFRFFTLCVCSIKCIILIHNGERSLSWSENSISETSHPVSKKFCNLLFSRIRPSEIYESIGQLVELPGRGIGPTQCPYLHTGQHNTEKSGHISIPRVGFEPTTPVFERSKTVRASDRSARGTG